MLLLKLYLVLFFQISVFLASNPLLLLISLDGFRYDLMNSHKLIFSNLWKLADEGVYFKYGIMSQFLTVTAPNHYSILTGLNIESHGIVANQFFDPKFGDYYDYFNFSQNATRAKNSREERWYTGRPITLLNQVSSPNRHTGCILFPHCDVRFSGGPLKEAKGWAGFQDFGNLTVWKANFDQLIGWYTRKEDPINLGLFYISFPDEVFHEFGINSDQARKNLTDINSLVGYMIERLKEVNLYEKMNIIVTADHGHSEYRHPENSIPLYEIIPKDWAVWSDLSVISVTNKSQLTMRQTYDKLRKARNAYPGLEVYWKSDFESKYPELHYSKNDRIGEIVVFHKSGWAIYHDTLENLTLNHNPGLHSTHGSLPGDDEMRPLLVLRGPAFRKNLILHDKNVQNTDLYPLMCNFERKP